MNTKTKSVFVLIAVFVLGALLGVVVDRTIVENQMRQRFSRFQGPGMARVILERIIRPTPGQRVQIDSILEKYGERFQKLRITTRMETMALMDSMRKEIDPILTDEQKEQIQRHIERMRRGAMREPLFNKGHWRNFRRPPEEGRPEPPPPIPPE
ncbi:hypothetical protein B6D60_04325 [candidate division KSB1 bacterium 4484_87]|nr:MAG: hypothetical protein B6D60_04325 [candidate division KSB1 bacterium 4484_87]